MRKPALVAAGLAAILVLSQSIVLAHDDPSHQKADAQSAPKLENLLKAVLKGVDGTEVVVSRVTIPPNTSLPKHWHPGEEFAYVIEGTVTLWQEGKDDFVVRAGGVAKVPLKQVHTAMTKDEGAIVLVFRVHEQGKPERVLIDKQ